MASRKLAPEAGKINNPRVPADAVNRPVADEAYQLDPRNVADQDGNLGQARKPRADSSASPRPRKKMRVTARRPARRAS
jgi:hypothetical protein